MKNIEIQVTTSNSILANLYKQRARELFYDENKLDKLILDRIPLYQIIDRDDEQFVYASIFLYRCNACIESWIRKNYKDFECSPPTFKEIVEKVPSSVFITKQYKHELQQTHKQSMELFSGEDLYKKVAIIFEKRLKETISHQNQAYRNKYTIKDDDHQTKYQQRNELVEYRGKNDSNYKKGNQKQICRKQVEPPQSPKRRGTYYGKQNTSKEKVIRKRVLRNKKLKHVKIEINMAINLTELQQAEEPLPQDIESTLSIKDLLAMCIGQNPQILQTSLLKLADPDADSMLPEQNYIQVQNTSVQNINETQNDNMQARNQHMLKLNQHYEEESQLSYEREINSIIAKDKSMEEENQTQQDIEEEQIIMNEDSYSVLLDNTRIA